MYVHRERGRFGRGRLFIFYVIHVNYSVHTCVRILRTLQLSRVKYFEIIIIILGYHLLALGRVSSY